MISVKFLEMILGEKKVFYFKKINLKLLQSLFLELLYNLDKKVLWSHQWGVFNWATNFVENDPAKLPYNFFAQSLYIWILKPIKQYFFMAIHNLSPK